MDLAAVQELMRDASAGVSELGMRNIDNFMKQGGKRLKKDGVVPGTTGKRIYALAIRFPFNPLDPKDERFNRNQKWESPLSPETTVLALKAEMRKNPELHAFYAEKGGFKVEEYDVSEDKITEQDWAVFGSYRGLLHYSMRIVKSTLTGHGKYGRKFLSKCKYDEDGVMIEKDDAELIHELEVAIANQKIAEIKEEYKTGSKAGKPEKDMQDEIKLAWNNVKITNPYFAGTIRCLVIPLTDEYEIEKPADVLKDGIKSYERYAGGSKQAIEKLSANLGKKADRNFNYIEVDIQYPKCPDVDKDQEARESYQKKSENSVNPVNRVAETVEGFDAAYREFRDDQDIFCEKVMLDSVFEYHAVDSSSLLEYYKTDLTDKKEYISEQACQTYKDLISRVDSQLSEELLDKLLDEKMESQDMESLEDLAQADEEMAGYGIDVSNTEESVVLD